MTKRTYMSVAVGFLLMGLMGCGLQKGETLFTTGPGAPTPMGKAPQDGTYSVYTAASPNPTATYRLHKGDALGFQKGDNGKLVGIAGDNQVELGILTVQAYWKLVE